MTDTEKHALIGTRSKPRPRIKLEGREYEVLAKDDDIMVISAAESIKKVSATSGPSSSKGYGIIDRMQRDFIVSSKNLAPVDGSGDFDFLIEDPTLPESRTAAEVEMERDAELAQLEANGTLPSYNERLKRANDLLALIGRHDPA